MKEDTSKGWIVVRTTGGEKFLCKSAEDLANPETVKKQVLITEVREIVSMNMQMAPGVISRRTMLAPVDFAAEPLPQMRVTISSWYKPEGEAKKAMLEEIQEEIQRSEEAKERALRAANVSPEEREAMEQLLKDQQNMQRAMQAGLALPSNPLALGQLAVRGRDGKPVKL